MCIRDRTLCQKALLQRNYGSSVKGSHEQVHIGDVVQILLRDRFKHRKFLPAFICTSGLPNFFVVGGFMRSKIGRSWAVLKEVELISPSSLSQIPEFNHPLLIDVLTPKFYTPQTMSGLYYLEMQSSVRKVGVAHNCSADGGCDFSFSTRHVVHSTNTLNGGRFFLLTRSMGYPPRRS